MELGLTETGYAVNPVNSSRRVSADQRRQWSLILLLMYIFLSKNMQNLPLVVKRNIENIVNIKGGTNDS